MHSKSTSSNELRWNGEISENRSFVKRLIHIENIDQERMERIRGSLVPRAAQTLLDLGFWEAGALSLGWAENLVGRECILFLDREQSTAVLMHRKGWQIISRMSDDTVVVTDSDREPGLSGGPGWQRRGTMGNLFDDLRGHEMHIHRIRSYRSVWKERFIEPNELATALRTYMALATAPKELAEILTKAGLALLLPATFIAILGWQVLNFAL